MNFIIISVIILQNDVYGKPSSAEYKKTCIKPLGMASGAIPNQHIDCTPGIDHVDGCNSNCDAARFNMSYGNSFWCRKPDYGFFKVGFFDMTVIHGIGVSSSFNAGITKLYLRYGYGGDVFTDYGLGPNTERKEFELNLIEDTIWLDVPIIARQIVIVPLAHANEVRSYFRSRFEFYGCSHYQFSNALGLENGFVTDNQLSPGANQINDNLFNPFTARLNTAMTGWIAAGTDIPLPLHNEPGDRRAWLVVDFVTRKKIISLAVQQSTEQEKQNQDFFIYYGDTGTTRPYTGIEKHDYEGGSIAKVISVVDSSIADEVREYVFLYPLVAERILYYPYMTVSQMYPAVKLEFYGISPTTATHRWTLRSNSLEDEVKFQNLLLSEDVTSGDEGLSITGPFSSPVCSLPFHIDDCLVDADKCGSGISVSFSAKVDKVPKGHLFTKPITAASIHDGCATTGNLNSNKMFALYIQSVEMRYAEVLLRSTNLEIQNMVGGLPNFKLQAEVYIDKEESFVTSCYYGSTTPLHYSSIEMDRSTSTYHASISNLLYPVFFYGGWQYGLSVVLVFRPVDSNMVDMSFSKTDVMLNMYKSNVCNNPLTYGVVSSLPDDMFMQLKAPCEDGSGAASDANMKKTGAWKNCAGDGNHLEINLSDSYHIFMLNVSGGSNSFVSEFYVEYALEANDWKKIYKYEDSASGEYIFKKHLVDHEYLLLPNPVIAQHLRIIPISNHGASEYLLKIDAGVCNNVNVDGNLYSVINSNNFHYLNFVISNDETKWIFLHDSVTRINWHGYAVGVTSPVGGAHHLKHTIVSGITFIRIVDNNNNIAMIKDGDIVTWDLITLSSVVTAIHFEVTETDIYIVSSEHKVFRKSRSTPHDDQPVEIDSSGLVNKIAVTPSGDVMYGLDVANSYVYKLDLINPKGWESLVETSCLSIKVSKVGTLWCLHNGGVFKWNPYVQKWSMVMPGSDCMAFDVASTYVLCLQNDYRTVYRKEILLSDVPARVTKIEDYFPGITKVSLTMDFNGIYTLNDNTSCIMRKTFGGDWITEHCGKCLMVSEYYYNAYACLKTSNHMMSPTNNFGHHLLSVEIEDFVSTGNNRYLYRERDTLNIYTRYGNTYTDYQESFVDMKELQFDNVANWFLKNDGNIYRNEELYSYGPCDTFRKKVNVDLYCMYEGNIYRFNVVASKWDVVFDEKKCDSFDVASTFVICWVVNDGLYQKYFDTGDFDYKFPIISSGLQRFKDVSIGTGFQVALSSSQSSLMVSIQTETHLTEATFGIGIENGSKYWNDYRFVWSKQSDILSLYVNGTFLKSETSALHPSSGSTKATTNFINFGGFYDHTSLYSQSFTLRDLNLWNHELTDEDIQSQEASIREVITFSNMDSTDDYLISGTCSRYSDSNGPCADSELSPKTGKPIYFYAPGLFTYDERQGVCTRYGSKPASVHSDEEMTRIYNLPVYGGTGVWLAMHGSYSDWEDGTPINYKRYFGSYNGECPEDQKYVYYLPLQHDRKWFCHWNKALEYRYVCKADGYILKKTYTLSSLQFWNETECANVPNPSSQILTILNSSRLYSLFTFDVSNLEASTLIIHAYMVYKAEDPNDLIDVDAYIGIVKDTYALCSMSMKDQLLYAMPINWTLNYHKNGEQVMSPDISSLVQYYINTKDERNSTNTLTIMLYWNDGTVQNGRKFSELSLEIYHNASNFYKFLQFSSMRVQPKFPPAIYATPPYPNMQLNFSFWYHMNGSEVGTLYVWFIDADNNADPYPAFVAQGDQGGGWNQAFIVPPIVSASWQIQFLAYRREKNVKNIAIDTIEIASSVPIDAALHNRPTYQIAGGSLYLSYLKQYGLPQPKMLFPFKKSYDGHAVYNKTLTGHDVSSFSWKNDKFAFPYHALNIIRAGNVLLQVEDIMDVAAVVTSEFTIAFNLKFQMLDTPITFCQFGSSGSNTIKIIIDNDKLSIKHGSADVYESSWLFVSDTWTYVGIIYKKNKLNVYYNNTLDNERDFSLTDEKPFPTSLHLLRDPSTVGAGDMFEGLISCFQFYNESMSPTQLEALEFCPDRIEPILCPLTCYSPGHCSPLKSDCDCPATLERYYLTNCMNGISDHRKNTIVDLNFDVPFDMEDSTYTEASPVNYGQCINNGSAVLANIANNCFLNNCDGGFILSFWFYVEEYRNLGNVTFFQLGNLKIGADFNFDLGSVSVITGIIWWKNVTTICEASFSLPLEVWTYINIWGQSHSLHWAINGKEYSGDGTCYGHTDVLASIVPSLSFGNTSKFCVDEVAIYNVENDTQHFDRLTDSLIKLYKVISKHDKDLEMLLRVDTSAPVDDNSYKSAIESYLSRITSFGSDVSYTVDTTLEQGGMSGYSVVTVDGRVSDKIIEEIEVVESLTWNYVDYNITWERDGDPYYQYQFLKLSDNYFATFEISVLCMSILWSNQISIIGSEENIGVLATFKKVIFDFFIDDITIGVEFFELKQIQFFESHIGTVQAFVDVAIKRHFFKYYVDNLDGLHSINSSNGFSFEIQRTNKSGGLPYAKIEYSAAVFNDNTIQINVTNSELLDRRYHKGYVITAFVYEVLSENYIDEEERIILTGKSSFLYTGLTTFRLYEISINALTHEGWSPTSNITRIQTPSTVNLIGPNFHDPQAQSSTELMLRWDHLLQNDWNAPHLFSYGVLYKNAFDIDADNLSTYEFANISSSTTSHLLTNLSLFTMYNLYLGTTNDVGFGGLSLKTVRTLPGPPEMAPNMTSIEIIDIVHVKFEWMPIPDDIEIYNGNNLSKYEIEIQALHPSLVSAECQTILDSVNSLVYSFQLAIGCRPWQSFKVYIAAINTEGFIGVTNEYCYTLGRYVPGRISVLNATTSDPIADDMSSVNITIGKIPIEHENTIVTHYEVRYKSIDWADAWKVVNISIGHSNEYKTLIENSRTYYMNCSRMGNNMASNDTIIPSSKIVHKTLPVYYYTNYEVKGRACSDEGCSMLNMTTQIRTAEHSPFCPPPNISIFNTSATSMKVTFEKMSHQCLSGQLQFYGILFFESEKFGEYDELTTEELKQTNVYNETTELEVTYFNLNEYWNYTVIVFAENNGGAGVLSAPVSALTAEAAPDGPPLNCAIHNYNSTSIVLSIGKPDRLLMNGLIHYKIVILNGFGDVITREVELAGEMTATVFSNLTKFMFHNISIRAVTTVGDGPEALIYNRTLEDVPSLPPTNVAVSNFTENSISLVWNDIPALFVHGILQTYNITGCGLLRNETWNCFHRDTVDKEVTFSVFPGTTYHFEIAGCTNVGCGPTSGLVQSSLEMVPSATVNNISAAWITTNSINISWTAVSPMERRGNVTYYNVSMMNIPHYWQSPQVDVSERFLISFETFMDHSITHILFENLNNYTTYRFNITAYTDVGPGPTSKEVEYTTEQNVPSMAPENVTAFDTSSSRLNVSWIPLHPSHHEGILLGYNISYNVSDGFTDIRGGYTQGYYLCEGGDRTSCEVNGLSLSTPFDIQVAGYTIRGPGPWSVKTNATTGIYIDGNWTSWTEWGSCSRSCGIGRLMRQRWCINPKPQLGGNNCTGSSKDYEECNNSTCPGYYLGKPGESCTDTCGSLEYNFGCTLNMEFQNTTKHFTSAIDIYNYTQFVNIGCNTSQERDLFSKSIHPSFEINDGLCEGYKNIPDKIDCDASPDSSRRRLCRCIDEESAQYTEWANWGMCSKTCGTGKYQRFRECVMANGCTGSNVALTDCNIEACPVDGLWSKWSPFSNCTKTCGFGSTIRTRTCTDPAPEHGGLDCEGGVDTEAIEGCNPYPCPVNGQWGPWQNVSECKFSCGNQGYKMRKRYCDNPASIYDGDDCIGNDTERFECEENQPCIPAKYIYTVRFKDEVWYLPMYNLANELSLNLSGRIHNEILKFYNSTHRPELVDTIKIEFNRMSKGSVIVRFSIEFDAVPHVESLILQHTIEGGNLNDMPTGLNSITVPNLPHVPPPSVQAESTTPFTIDVKWSRLNASIINGNLHLYQVFFKKLEGDNIANEQWDNFGTKDLYYTLRDLAPGVLYGIRVLASNDHGNGVASSLLVIRTIEGVPYIKPPESKYQSLDERTVYFSWDEIPAHQVPGVLRGYEIKYRKYKETSYMYERTDETLLQKTVSNFKPFTWYWVEVAGFTNAGVGPHEVFVFQTPPGAPEIAPPNATAHSYYSTEEMLVTWDFIPKNDENGYLFGYKVYYRKYQQGGIDTVGEPFVVVILDRFTRTHRMKGLESYTQYEITIYGYSAYGDGPSAVIYGDTCKCPEHIFNNWYEKKPYTQSVSGKPGVVEGLFPDLLTMVVNSVCMNCKSYLPTLHYNKTRDGRSSKKRHAEDVKKYVDDNVHMSFPIFGRFALTRFAGVHPFVGIIQSQGSAMLVYQPEYNTVGFAAILGAVAGAWPVILIAVLLAYMAGCVFWFLEQSADECDLTQNRALYGSYEGFWMSFITMTTLGYGDYVPYANVTKGAMIFWILMGLCIVSIFGGAVSSGMSVGALSTEYKLYGSTVAAVKNSFEYRTAILRNAEVDPQVNYSSIVDVINAVSNRNVEIGFVDAISTQGYEKELVSKHVKIYKILHLDSGFGVVLSGEFARVENDMRSFVSSNQAKISSFVEKKIGILQPAILDVEELLLTPEESQSLLLNLLIIYCVMAVISIVVSYFVRNRASRKVSPEGAGVAKLDELNDCLELFEDFKNNIEMSMESLDVTHMDERVRLNDLKRNFAMHLKRGKVTLPEEPPKKKKPNRSHRYVHASDTKL